MTLPEGWESGRFEGLITVVRGVTFSKDQKAESPIAGHIPCLRSGNVQSHLTTKNLIYVPNSVVKSSERIVRDGDVIVSMSNSYDLVGKVARADESHEGMTFGAFLSSFRSDVFDSGFLFSLLRSPSMQENIRATASQTVNISNLSISGMAGIVLPVPPAAEQRRIAAKLDVLTASIVRARKELDRIPALAAKLRRHVLGDAFRLDARGTINLGDVVDDVRYGTAQKCDYNGGATPVLRIPNIQRGKVDLADVKSSSFSTKETDKLALRRGDVLVIRSNGSLDLVGKSAVVGVEAESMLYAGYLIRLRPSLEKVNPYFLHHFLQSPAAREAIASGARSTSGVNNVNAQQLQALSIPVRDLSEQEEAVALINSAFARANRLEAEATRARALLDRLEAAILAKAFRGELVPQDSNDEPASVLLDRIRAERAAAPKPKRGRARKAVD